MAKKEVHILITESPAEETEELPAPTLIYSSFMSNSPEHERKRRSTITPQIISQLEVQPRKSIDLQCDYCQSTVDTTTKVVFSTDAYFWCFFFFFCGAIICSWLPFTLTEMKRTKFTCPNCHSTLASHKPSYKKRTKIVLGSLTFVCVSVVTLAILYWIGVIKLSPL